MEHVQPIGLQALQARFDHTQRAVAIAGRLGNLGREDDLVASGLHQQADAPLALAVAVADRGIDVRDALIDRVRQDADRHLLVRVRQEAAAAAEGQDRHLQAGAAEAALSAMCRRRCRLPASDVVTAAPSAAVSRNSRRVRGLDIRSLRACYAMILRASWPSGKRMNVACGSGRLQ